MKRWKRALSAFTVATVMCFSIAAAGCGGNDDNGGDEADHSQHNSWSEWKDDTSKGDHYRECEAEGCDEVERHAHVYDGDEDTDCNDCGHVRVVGGDEADHSQHNSWSEWKDDTTAGDHYRECEAEGCDEVERHAHVYDNDQDTDCNDCGHVREVGGGEQPGESSDVVINIASLFTEGKSTLSDGTKLGEGVELIGEHNINSNGGKKPIVNGTEITDAGYRLQLKGMDKNGGRGIKLTLSASATVLVYGISGSSGDIRQLSFYNELATTEATALQSANIGSSGNYIDTAIFEAANAGMFYIGASDQINIYYIIVSYDGINETELQHVTAKTATCTEAGNSEYHLSNYGRYYTVSGSQKTYITAQQAHAGDAAALGHDYEATAITAASETTEGSATLVCKNDSSHTIPVILPVLTSVAYASRPELGETGDYVYVSNGVNITFQAVGVATKADSYSPVYDISDFTGVTVGNAKPESGNGVYIGANGTATVEDGTLHVTGNSAGTAEVRFALGETISSGVVKISGRIKSDATNSNWSFFQIRNSANEEIISFRTVSQGKWGYRVDHTSNLDAASAPISNNEYHDFEIIIDLDNGTVSITVDGTVLAKNVGYAGTNNFNIGYVGITANDGRHVYLDSLTVATKN